MDLNELKHQLRKELEQTQAVDGNIKFFADWRVSQSREPARAREDEAALDAQLDEYISQLPHWSTLQKRFGQWKAVWQQAGVYLNAKGEAKLQMSSRFTDAELVDLLQEFAIAVEGRPSKAKWEAYAKERNKSCDQA